MGLETCLEMTTPPDELSPDTFIVDGHDMWFADTSPFYWKRLVEICNEARLKVELLDDFNLYKEYYRKLLEAERHKQRISLEYMYEDAPRWTQLTEEQLREARERIFHAEAEAEYIHVVRREEQIVDNAINSCAQVIVMGRGHGDYIASRGGVIGKTQLFDVENYIREKVEPWMSARRQGQSGLVAQIDTDTLSSQDALSRELLVRRYNAATQRRIFPERTPDFIGTWAKSCRPEGFEIYLNGSMGTKEDCLGTATVTSFSSSDRSVSFCNEYIEGRSLNSLKSKINYRAESVGLWSGDIYRGQWSAGRAKGEFYMCRGDKLNLSVPW